MESSSSSEEEELMLLAVSLLHKKKRKKRRVWVKEIFQKRDEEGIKPLITKMKISKRETEYDEKSRFRLTEILETSCFVKNII